MENNYLNSILGVLSAVQARQISELLQGLQASGAVRNKEEYSSKLAELSSLLNGAIPQPSFSPIRSVSWDLCSSDAHNLMTQAIKNDIEAAFIQINEMGEKLEDHHLLFIDNLLADLERGLQRQSNKITELELLADNNNSYTDVLVNDFTSDHRQIPNETISIFNNRTKSTLEEEEIPFAYISDGSSLVLNSESNPRINPVSVKLQTDNYSYATERNVDEETSLSNLIDGKENTFWTYSVYLADTVPKVHVILDLSLGTSKDVNYIVLDPASSEPLYITNIEGISSNGDRVTLSSTETLIDGITRINFQRYNLSNILVTISTKTLRRGEYFTSNNKILREEEDALDRANAIGPIAREILNSNEVANICNTPEEQYRQIYHNIYTISLDNIWCGNSLYSNMGLFLSTPLSIANIGNLAVKAQEELGSGTITSSIEYDIVKIDTSPKHNETRFAIPKLNQSSITSERIILTKRSGDSLLNNIALLRFLPISDSITLYKNGIALTQGPDWQFAISEAAKDISETSLNWNSNIATLDYSDYNIAPLGFYIKLLNVDSRAAYTVDYSIFTSETLDNNNSYVTVWLDKEKQSFLTGNSEIAFLKNEDYYIESDIYLQITMRRNLSSRASSPKLNEYILLANRYHE